MCRPRGLSGERPTAGRDSGIEQAVSTQSLYEERLAGPAGVFEGPFDCQKCIYILLQTLVGYITP